MRRTFRTVTLIVFAVVVLGCAFAVLYLGTSTGLTFGDPGTQLTQAAGAAPVYGEVGWLRNTAPWPITIERITTNAVNVRSEPIVYLERAQSGSPATSGTAPAWTHTSSHPPFQLDGGALRFLGFAVAPDTGAVARMTSITIDFTGPLGLRFHSSFSGTRVAAASSTLPVGVLGADPRSDSTSLDGYIAALRATLLQPDPNQVAVAMGDGATAADGSALLKLETGYVTSDAVLATSQSKDGREQTVVFYAGNLAKGALPAISVKWSGYRWSVVRP
jgi:hypothetical protein